MAFVDPSQEAYILDATPKLTSPMDDIARQVSMEHPVHVCLSRDPAASTHHRGDGQPSDAALPFNTLEAIPFETPLFKGRVVFNIAGLKPPPKPPATSADAHKLGLNGCQGRAMECVIQGRFKRRIRFDELYTGQSFNVPLRRLPARWLIKATEAIVKSLAPATQLSIMGPKPFLMGPLASIASFFSVKRLGPEEDEDSLDIFGLGEDTALLGGVFGGERGGGASSPTMERNARKRFFSSTENLQKFHFETDLIYGFGFFGDRWRVNECKLDLGVAQIDMAYYLGQAPRVMARLKDTEEYAWAFDIWHRRLLISSVDAAGGEEHDMRLSQSLTDASSPGRSLSGSTTDSTTPNLWSWLRKDSNTSSSSSSGSTPRTPGSNHH